MIYTKEQRDADLAKIAEQERLDDIRLKEIEEANRPKPKKGFMDKLFG